MKLSMLHEEFTGTGAIAFRPAVLGKGGPRDTERKRNKLGQSNGDRWYLKFSRVPNASLKENEG